MKTTLKSLTKKLFKTEMYKRFKNERIFTLLNHTFILPEVGMGVTTGYGSDCYPHTIIEVAPDLSYIIIQSDNHECAKGFEYYGNQVYNYSRNENASKSKYTLRKNGCYMEEGASIKAYYFGAHIGHRRYYQDPSF